MNDTSTATPTTSTTSTPSAAPSTPSSAPSTATPSDSTPTPAARPSFKTALRQADEKIRTVPTPPPGTATIQPDVVTATPPATKGPIPFDVHDTALKNARTKEREAYIAEQKQKYGEDYDELDSIITWRKAAKANPAQFVEQMIFDGLTNPTAAPAVRSVLGKMLNAMRAKSAPTAPSAPAALDMPKPDFHDGQGNELYSAKQMPAIVEYIKGQLQAEIAPLKQETDAIRAEREAAEEARQTHEAQQRVAKEITSHVAKAKESWPYFKQYEAQIKQALSEMPITSGHPAEEAMALRDAYDRVVLPKLDELTQNRVVAEMQTRANATSLNPAATGVPSGIPKSVRAKDGGSFGAALKWAESQQAGR